MASSRILYVFLSFFFLAAIAPSSSSVEATSNTWDFLLYVVQWPGTVDQEPVPSGVNSFTIHGVWPTNNDTTYPQYCTDATFSLSAVANIESQLNVDWPSLTGGGTNEEFWSHEYEKHGTCAEDGQVPSITDELSFFNFALNLHASYDSLQGLERGGVTPSSSQTYTLKDFTSALQNAFGATPMITCQSSSSGSSSGYQLLTIMWCVDNSGQVFECAEEFYTKTNEGAECGSGDSISFPPMQYSTL